MDVFSFRSLLKDLHEIYDYRNVLKSIVTKNLFGKYKNSFLGFAWNFITPLVMMIMYYIIFSEIRTGSNIENKWLFISSAIFLFHFLTSCITGGTGAFTSNVNMIKKMYVPKEIFVLSKAISSMIICLIGTVIVMIAMIVTSYPMDWTFVLTLPLLLFLSFIFGIGCIFFFSSITVYIRDIQYALGSLGIALFVMTPMRYMASDAEGLLATLIWYNPLTYFIEWDHQILYWGIAPSINYIVASLILSILALFVGYATFRKLRRGFVKRL